MSCTFLGRGTVRTVVYPALVRDPGLSPDRRLPSRGPSSGKLHRRGPDVHDDSRPVPRTSTIDTMSRPRATTEDPRCTSTGATDESPLETGGSPRSKETHCRIYCQRGPLKHRPDDRRVSLETGRPSPNVLTSSTRRSPGPSGLCHLTQEVPHCLLRGVSRFSSGDLPGTVGVVWVRDTPILSLPPPFPE